MSHNEIQVGAVMSDRLREARAARLVTAAVRSRRARQREGRFARATRRQTW
jgi:hypothetical protein